MMALMLSVSTAAGVLPTAMGPAASILLKDPILLKDCSVVLHPAEATAGEAFAAAELALIGGNISNGNIPLHIKHNATGGAVECELAVGYGASVDAGLHPGQLVSLSSAEAYVIHRIGPSSWAITGGRDSARGAMLGVYEFVERLGFRQLAWDSVVLPPHAPNARVDLAQVALEATQSLGAPSGIVWREFDDWDNFNNRNFSRRMRYNGGNGDFDCVYHEHGETKATCEGPGAWDQCPGGNCWASPPGGCHSIYFLLCTNGSDPNPDGQCGPIKANDTTHVPGQASLVPRQDLILQHPEWFYPHPSQCETGAQRAAPICVGSDCQPLCQSIAGVLGPANETYGQVCWGKPSLVAFLVQQAKAVMRAQPWASRISITQNDNLRFCQDADELAIIEEEGGAVIAPMLRAANAIADALANDYPAVLVDTFAYIQTFQVPTKTKPRPNVVPRLCTEVCNFAQPISQGADNANIRGNITAWGKMSKQTTVWDYNTNFLMLPTPFPDWYALARNLKFLHASGGMTGYMGEANTYSYPGSDLHELKTYIVSRLLWNITRDPGEEFAYFLNNYYGPGAFAVKLYMDTMVGSMQSEGFCRADGGQSITFPPTVPFLSPLALLTAAQGFQEGEVAAAQAPTFLFRLQRAAMNPRYVILLRWEEIRNFSSTHAIPWPLAQDKLRAYEEWEATANTTSDSALGRYGALGTYGARQHPLSWFREQVMNVSAKDWCRDVEHNNSLLTCDPDWVKEQPCCASCGDHPFGMSNVCMDETRSPGQFLPLQYEL